MSGFNRHQVFLTGCLLNFRSQHEFSNVKTPVFYLKLSQIKNMYQLSPKTIYLETSNMGYKINFNKSEDCKYTFNNILLTLEDMPLSDTQVLA